MESVTNPLLANSINSYNSDHVPTKFPTIVFSEIITSTAKILISGGGRCNYTNLYTEAENFISDNPHFCKSAFSQWTVADTLSFFETYGIEGAEKTLGQLFPTTNKAKDIVAVFENLCADLGQEIKLEAEVKSIKQSANGFERCKRSLILYL